MITIFDELILEQYVSKKSADTPLSPKDPQYFKKIESLNGGHGIQYDTTDAYSTSKRVLNFKACNSKTAKVIY